MSVKPQVSREQKQIFTLLLVRANMRIGKIRYAVLEEVCETYEEMAYFYNMIQDSGCEIIGEFPDRVKKALKEYDINIK